MSTSDIATARELRSQGLSFHKIARQVHRSIEYVKKACEDMPMPQKSINYRIGRYISANPTLTNEQIAQHLGFDVAYIADRRRKMNPQHARCHDRRPTNDDANDRGRRLKPFWIRQHCSRGERTKWQLQALVTAAGFQFNLIEIARSAEEAGLAVDEKTGLISAPEKLFENLG